MSARLYTLSQSVQSDARVLRGAPTRSRNRSRSRRGHFEDECAQRLLLSRVRTAQPLLWLLGAAYAENGGMCLSLSFVLLVAHPAEVEVRVVHE